MACESIRLETPIGAVEVGRSDSLKDWQVIIRGNGAVSENSFADQRMGFSVAELVEIACDWRHTNATRPERIDLSHAAFRRLENDFWPKPPQTRDARIYGLELERDEWKRRAESAEAEIAQAKRAIHAAMRESGATAGTGVTEFIRELHARVTRLEAMACPCGCNKLREGPTHVAGSAKALVERGLGIVRLNADNSVAWLDEDLLCEDAP